MTYYYTILTSQFKPVLQTFKGLKLRKVHLLRFYYLLLLTTTNYLQIVVGYVFKAYGNVEIFNIYIYYTLEPLKALNLQANYYTLLACKFRSFEEISFNYLQI